MRGTSILLGLERLGHYLNKYRRTSDTKRSGAGNNKSGKTESSGTGKDSGNAQSKPKEQYISGVDRIALFASIFIALDLGAFIIYVISYIMAKREFNNEKDPKRKVKAKERFKRAGLKLKKHFKGMFNIISTFGGRKARIAKYIILKVIKFAKKLAKVTKNKSMSSLFKLDSLNLMNKFFDLFGHFGSRVASKIHQPNFIVLSRFQGESLFEFFIRKNVQRFFSNSNMKPNNPNSVELNTLIMLTLTTVYFSIRSSLVENTTDMKLNDEQTKVMSEVKEMLKEDSILSDFLEDSHLSNDEEDDLNILADELDISESDLLEIIMVMLSESEDSEKLIDRIQTAIKIPIRNFKIPEFYGSQKSNRAKLLLSTKYYINPTDYARVKELINEAVA